MSPVLLYCCVLIRSYSRCIYMTCNMFVPYLVWAAEPPAIPRYPLAAGCLFPLPFTPSRRSRSCATSSPSLIRQNGTILVDSRQGMTYGVRFGPVCSTPGEAIGVGGVLRRPAVRDAAYNASVQEAQLGSSAQGTLACASSGVCVWFIAIWMPTFSFRDQVVKMLLIYIDPMQISLEQCNPSSNCHVC